MRILHIAHQQLRKYGHNRVSWAQKLYFGLIRNGWLVQSFSDRDVAAFEAPLGIRDMGKKKANQRLLQTVEAFEPDLILVGHADIISNDTLAEARRLRPGVVISGLNNDPLFVPDNATKIEHRCKLVDTMFVSTGERELVRFGGARARLRHMPNPVDEAIDVEDASASMELIYDLLFCSKETSYTSRGQTVQFLIDRLAAADSTNSFSFHTPGSHGVPGVWGRDYERVLAQSRMGLNLNRQEGDYWYSSARMAQLAGNGLLTFTHSSGGFQDLFPPETLVYFDSNDSLLERVLEFHHDDSKRRYWAARGRDFFHRELNSTLYARYIVEVSMDLPFSHNYVWQQAAI